MQGRPADNMTSKLPCHPILKLQNWHSPENVSILHVQANGGPSSYTDLLAEVPAAPPAYDSNGGPKFGGQQGGQFGGQQGGQFGGQQGGQFGGQQAGQYGGQQGGFGGSSQPTGKLLRAGVLHTVLKLIC